MKISLVDENKTNKKKTLSLISQKLNIIFHQEIDPNQPYCYFCFVLAVAFHRIQIHVFLMLFIMSHILFQWPFWSGKQISCQINSFENS